MLVNRSTRYKNFNCITRLEIQKYKSSFSLRLVTNQAEITPTTRRKNATLQCHFITKGRNYTLTEKKIVLFINNLLQNHHYLRRKMPTVGDGVKIVSDVQSP